MRHIEESGFAALLDLSMSHPPSERVHLGGDVVTLKMAFFRVS